MILEYEPSLEPLRISGKQLFLNKLINTFCEINSVRRRYWVGCQQQGGWVQRHLAISDHWLDRYMAAFYFMASTM